MPKTALTATTVASFCCPEGVRKIDLFDTKTKGLLLEVRKRGKIFYFRYRSERDITRQMRLADASTLRSVQRNVASWFLIFVLFYLRLQFRLVPKH